MISQTWSGTPIPALPALWTSSFTACFVITYDWFLCILKKKKSDRHQDPFQASKFHVGRGCCVSGAGPAYSRWSINVERLILSGLANSSPEIRQDLHALPVEESICQGESCPIPQPPSIQFPQLMSWVGLIKPNTCLWREWVLVPAPF